VIAAVDTGALLELMWAAPAAVLAVTISWGLVIRGMTLAFEAQRAGRTGAVVRHALVAVAGLALFTAAVAFGLVIMLSKD
jgi:hypothetical protein